jgi:hypothetical protein
MQVVFGRTPLLNDVKRGLKGSGSAESVNRLAVIMLLTLSIVTLAAVQGYTGTLVDEKTVDAQVGSDLKITVEQPIDEATLLALVGEFTASSVTPVATSVPELALADSTGGDSLQTYVLLDQNGDVLRWSEQALPGEDVEAALAAYAAGGFSAGEDSAYSLDLPGSDRGGDENRLDDVLLKPGDEKSETLTFVWEKIDFNFTTGGSNQSDPLALFEAYTLLMDSDWSRLNLSGQSLSGRDIGRVDLSGSNLSGANLADVNLSEAILVDADLSYADLSGANLQNTVLVNFMGGSLEGTDFTNANLDGAFGFCDLAGAVLTNPT